MSFDDDFVISEASDSNLKTEVGSDESDNSKERSSKGDISLEDDEVDVI